MNQIDEDRHVKLALECLGLDAVDLVLVAVDQGDPGASMVGISSLCLVKDVADHRGCVIDHARSQPLVHGLGSIDRLVVL